MVRLLRLGHGSSYNLRTSSRLYLQILQGTQSMNVLKTIKPGDHGSQRFVREWGDRLVAVRYRADRSRPVTLTTIEIVVDERPVSDPAVNRLSELNKRRKAPVAVRVEFDEHALRARVKAAGGRWQKDMKLWLIKYDDAVAMGMTDRIVQGAAEKCPDWNLGIW